MRPRRTRTIGKAVRRVADVRLLRDVAQRVIGDRLRRVRVYLIRGQAVHRIITERLRHILDCVATQRTVQISLSTYSYNQATKS